MTSPRAVEQMQFNVVEAPVRAVAGFTDGIQGLCLDLAARRPHDPFFNRVFAPLRGCTDATELKAPLIALLDSSLVNDRTDDDKTLVLACRNLVSPTAEEVNLAGSLTDADAVGG